MDDATPPRPPDAARDDPAGIAPRPRPGFRSRPAPQVDPYEKARLFAGMTRAVLGCVGFFASLLYMPIQMVTPVLAGVSVLMMVTGTTSVWRALREAPALQMLTRAVALMCTLVALVTVVLTMVLGAGALGPLKDMPRPGRDDGAVRFEMQP